MERMNFVKDGVLRLPPGFRFHPTDEELVVQYLTRKVHSFPLPASIIPEVDVCKSDPWDLPGDLEQERYFFSTREVKYPNGNRSNRATGSGYWKATGLDKQIATSSRGAQIVGTKKTLVFYRGKPPHGARTDWIMHEYRLVPHKSPTAQNLEKWVLCRIFLKKRSDKKQKNRNNREEEDEEEEEEEREETTVAGVETKSQPIFFYDFMAKERADLNMPPPPTTPSSSGSSGVTDACSHDKDDHEESSTSSCCNHRLSTLRRKQCTP